MPGLSLFILGCSALCAQVMMTRELAFSLYGNELFLGWILAAWLFWVGAGSILPRIFPGIVPGIPSLISCHFLVAGLIPAGILGIRFSHGSLALAGQTPDILPALAMAILAPAPLCLVLGVHFTLAVGVWASQREDKEKVWVAGQAYLIEVLGFVVGAAAFNYYLIGHNEWRVSAILAGLNVLAAGCMLRRAGARPAAAVAIMACLAVICFCHADGLHQASMALKYPGEAFVASRNSVYGHVAVTRSGEQYNYYQNGFPAGTDREDMASEALVHIPMLTHPAPRKVLVVGTGFNGAVREVLRHGPAEVYDAELDPALLDLARPFLSTEMRSAIDDPRVHILKGDLRAHLDDLPGDLDVVIAGLPAPSTALVNRYFTVEFYAAMRRCMKPGGVLAVRLDFAPDTVSPALEELAAGVLKTLEGVFPSVVTLPAESLLFLAGSAPFTRDPRLLAERLAARGIRTHFVTAPELVYRYTNDRVQKVERLLAANRTTRVNRDLFPSGYFYQQICWLSVFHRQAAAWLSAMMKGSGMPVALAAGLGLGLFFFRQDRRRPVAAMFFGGFSLMAAEVLVIYGYQVFYGNMFYKLAWIITFIMLGMAAGVISGNRCRQGGMAGLAGVHAGFTLVFAVWILALWIGTAGRPPEILWLSLCLGVGFIAGFEFPYVVRLMAAHKDHAPGVVYQADVWGSCAGALGVSGFLLPVCGFYQTLLFLAVLNAAVAVFLWARRWE